MNRPDQARKVVDVLLVEDDPGDALMIREAFEHHGGRIWLDTDVPRGTTFRFTLPVAEEVAR